MRLYKIYYFGYTDDVLKQTSKKWVEKHLLECEKCQEKLKEIRKEEGQENENQKAQIDYLKKIRRQNQIKSWLLTVGILSAILVGFYGYKFLVLSHLAYKAERQLRSENFYIEKIASIGTQGEMSIDKTWYKDGKYKCVSYIEKDEKITQTFETRYGNMMENTKEEYFINEETKTARKETLLFANQKYALFGIENPIWLSNTKYYHFLRLGAPFYTKITTDYEEMGHLYYVLELEHGKQWIDKDTGLPIMRFGYQTNTKYYKHTKIPIASLESIEQYQYQFETVTEQDVQMPDLQTYEITNWNWETEIQKY